MDPFPLEVGTVLEFSEFQNNETASSNTEKYLKNSLTDRISQLRKIYIQYIKKTAVTDSSIFPLLGDYKLWHCFTHSYQNTLLYLTQRNTLFFKTYTLLCIKNSALCSKKKTLHCYAYIIKIHDSAVYITNKNISALFNAIH